MPRVHGFLDEAIKEINARPGQSATEIVNRLLLEGKVTSAAINPIGSLVATLHKHHPSKSVRREWVGGEYRFYPEAQANSIDVESLPKSVGHTTTVGAEEWIPSDCAEFIDALLVLGRFNSHREAIVWLVRKGMESVKVN